jgi:hypothetical protein
MFTEEASKQGNVDIYMACKQPPPQGLMALSSSFLADDMYVRQDPIRNIQIP